MSDAYVKLNLANLLEASIDQQNWLIKENGMIEKKEKENDERYED